MADFELSLRKAIKKILRVVIYKGVIFTIVKVFGKKLRN